MKAAAKAYGGEATDRFRAFITHLDKGGFSSLNSASKEDHLEVVTYLLEQQQKPRRWEHLLESRRASSKAVNTSRFFSQAVECNYAGATTRIKRPIDKTNIPAYPVSYHTSFRK